MVDGIDGVVNTLFVEVDWRMAKMERLVTILNGGLCFEMMSCNSGVSSTPQFINDTMGIVYASYGEVVEFTYLIRSIKLIQISFQTTKEYSKS
jgi:hypothetical protein